MRRKLCLETLQHLDFGKVRAAVDRHINRAVADCIDRPGDANSRKVVLTLEMKPELDEAGQCADVDLQCQVSSSVPKHRSKIFKCLLQGEHLVFNDESEDAHQGTLDELGADKTGDSES